MATPTQTIDKAPAPSKKVATPATTLILFEGSRGAELGLNTSSLVFFETASIERGDNKKQALYTPFTIVPGVQEIPQARWEVVQDSPLENIQEALGPLGVLREIEPWELLSPRDRIYTVKQCLDPSTLPLLRAWREDASAEVEKAIDSQIKELESGNTNRIKR